MFDDLHIGYQTPLPDFRAEKSIDHVARILTLVDSENIIQVFPKISEP